MKTIQKTFFLFFLLPFFVGCIDDNDSKLDNYHIDIATVINPDQHTSFLFQLDNQKLMWTEAATTSTYIPKDGQRIVANYTLLSDKPTDALYDYKVKLNDVYTVLTKGIFAIKPAQQDSIGNDSITVKDIWVGSDYLNVEFVYPGSDKIHFISLVSDASKVYTDGKTHLEFRHNSNDDSPVAYHEGVVSFNLKSLKPASASALPINLVIHVNIPNQTAEKTYELKYPAEKANSTAYLSKMTIPLQKKSRIN